MLGAAMAMLPIAPPEHVHEAEAEDTFTSSSIVNAKVHDILDRHADDHQQVEDDDGPALTLNSTFNLQPPQSLEVRRGRRRERIEPPAPRRLERSFADIELQIHGPPRTPTPLAPAFLACHITRLSEAASRYSFAFKELVHADTHVVRGWRPWCACPGSSQPNVLLNRRAGASIVDSPRVARDPRLD